MRHVATLVATALFLGVAGSAAAWSTSSVGGMPEVPLDLSVGDADGNGKRELLVGWFGGVARFAKTSSGWERTLLDASTVYAVAVGDGDRDGKSEMFLTLNDLPDRGASVARYEWTGSAWDLDELAHWAPPPDGDLIAAHLVIGDAENDGLTELYVTVANANSPGDTSVDGVYKVWFRDGAWHRTRVVAMDLHSLVLADGDRDGKRELYGSTGDEVWQVKRASGAWVAKLVGEVTPGSWVGGLAVADARQDGKRDVYAADGNASLWRFTWDGSKWVKQRISVLATTPTDLGAADLDGNGRDELYAGTVDGRVLQRRWDGSAWAKATIADVSGGIQDLSIGDPDNDGVREVYVGTSHDEVWRIRR